jgi:Mg2+ and Co2+ transporter CorA
VTLRATLFDASGEDRDLDLTADQPPKLGNRQLLWVDLDERSPDDLRRVAQAIGLEEVALERLTRENRRGPILRLEGHVALTVIAVDPGDETVERHEIDLVIGPNHVVTVHHGPLEATAHSARDVEREPELGRLDAVGFAAGLLDEIFAAYFRQVEAIEERIDTLDCWPFGSPRDEPFLDDVVQVRRRIARLRRAIVPEPRGAAAAGAARLRAAHELGRSGPASLQRLERAIDGLENARELLVGSFDLYLGRSSHGRTT